VKTGYGTRTAPPIARRFGLSCCPNCNDVVLAPAVSEHVNEREIRHLWACEACGHEFTTAVRLKAGRIHEQRAVLC